MNTIIDPTDNMGYSITSEIGRNILKNYLTNYKNGGSRTFRPVTVYCDEDEGVITCSSKNPSGPQIPIHRWVRRKGLDNKLYYENTGTREIRNSDNPPPGFERDLDYQNNPSMWKKTTNIYDLFSDIPENDDAEGWENLLRSVKNGK